MVNELGFHVSTITVSNMIRLVERQNTQPLSHQSIREIFSVDRQIVLSDIVI